MSEYIAKASIEPRDYRVVFLIQIKTSRKISEGFCLSITSLLPDFHGLP